MVHVDFLPCPVYTDEKKLEQLQKGAFGTNRSRYRGVGERKGLLATQTRNIRWLKDWRNKQWPEQHHALPSYLLEMLVVDTANSAGVDTDDTKSTAVLVFRVM